jgi:hypothetical protein
MTGELCGDLAGAQTIPTAHDHPGVTNPISGRMAAVGQFCKLAHLSRIER